MCLDREPRQQAQQEAAQVFHQTFQPHPEEDGRLACWIHFIDTGSEWVSWGWILLCAGLQCCSLGADQEGNQNSPDQNTSAGFHAALRPLTPPSPCWLFIYWCIYLKLSDLIGLRIYCSIYWTTDEQIKMICSQQHGYFYCLNSSKWIYTWIQDWK